MSTPFGLEQLTARLQRTGFARVSVYLQGHRLDLDRGVPDRAGRRDAARVLATAPGVVQLQVREGAQVTGGAPVGHLQVNTRQEALIAPVTGIVEAVNVADGEFVEFGTEVATVGPSPSTA